VKLDGMFQRLWYRGGPVWLLVLLLPLSLVFAVCVGLRRALYGIGLLRSVKVGRPVIVVGNVTVGGTGKTPFAIWLVGLLQQRGQRVGVVLRGYGGTSKQWPREVVPHTDPAEVGDEAVLIAIRTGAIVVVAPDRVAAAQRAIELGAEVIVADDGLQHYRLARDCEIAVVDERRAFGNGLLLPAGPLREPVSRLRSVNLFVRTRRSAVAASLRLPADAPQIVVTSRLGLAVSLASGATRTLESFRSGPVYAVAGIGNPEAFFTALEERGLQVIRHPLPDHAAIRREDIDFADDAQVLMTQKDAVKCRMLAPGLPRERPQERYWAVSLELEVSDADIASFRSLLDSIVGSYVGSGAPKQ
jgi:tetraacyldisaccharide 4'-kinase